MKSETTWKEMHASDRFDCRQEKFSLTQCRFIRASNNLTGNRLYCEQELAEIHPPGFQSKLLTPQSCQITSMNNQQILSSTTCPSSQGNLPENAATASLPKNLVDDIPSFSAITDGLHSVPAPQMTSFHPSNYSLPGSSTLVANSYRQSFPRNSNHSSPFLYSNSPLSTFNNNSAHVQNRFGTPISDPLLVKLLEDYEAECIRNDTEAAKHKLFQNFCSATAVQQVIEMPSKQVIFLSPTQAEFYKTMTSVLRHLDTSQRIFQVDDVWVDQKIQTVSVMPGCWMNPHALDCYSKILNTDQLIRGRQGLIPNSDVISHIVQREDMELLMRPLLEHSDPICRDMLSEASVGFSLQNANFVYLPCFNDKQWIVITANLQTGRFFDIMNPGGSGNDKFTTIISTVTFNFKTLFAKSYPNCTAFNIKDFDYRFVPVPKTHFRYDTGVFLFQILKTYRGMGVPGFSTDDLQALREIFLYEIATYSNSQVQLPIVKTFLQKHGCRLFK